MAPCRAKSPPPPPSLSQAGLQSAGHEWRLRCRVPPPAHRARRARRRGARLRRLGGRAHPVRQGKAGRDPVGGAAQQQHVFDCGRSGRCARLALSIVKWGPPLGARLDSATERGQIRCGRDASSSSQLMFGDAHVAGVVVVELPLHVLPSLRRVPTSCTAPTVFFAHWAPPVGAAARVVRIVLLCTVFRLSTKGVGHGGQTQRLSKIAYCARGS